MLAFLLRETEIVLAGGAFFVDVGLSVSPLAFSELEILSRLVKELQKCAVFRLSLVEIL